MWPLPTRIVSQMDYPGMALRNPQEGTYWVNFDPHSALKKEVSSAALQLTKETPSAIYMPRNLSAEPDRSGNNKNQRPTYIQTPLLCLQVVPRHL